MQPDRPVRLTFPAREPGARRIMAGKLQVGHALAGWTGRTWTAYLWLAADDPDEGFAEHVQSASVRSLREAVVARLAEGGSWWTC